MGWFESLPDWLAGLIVLLIMALVFPWALLVFVGYSMWVFGAF